MNVSSVSAQDSIMRAPKSGVSSQVQNALEAEKIANADVKISTSKEDSVTISKESPKPPTVEDFGDINDNEIKPNSQALEHMSNGEAASFGSGTLIAKEVDTMKSIAMSNYVEHVVEMNLPSNQVPNQSGNNFQDTDESASVAPYGEINQVNINININASKNGDKISPLENNPKIKTEQTGPAE